jgi:hypothetical protein
MRSRLSCVLLGLAMGWTVAGTPAGAASLPKDGRLPDRTAPPYTTQRVIALQKGTSSCPEVSGWRVETLQDLAKRRADKNSGLHERAYETYDNPTPAPADQGRDRRSAKVDALLQKEGLDRFCVYTASEAKAKFPQPKSVGLERAEADRMALTPTASAELGAVGAQTWPALADQFLAQVGKVRLAPTSTPSVRLVFIDTHPTGDGPPVPPVPSTSQPYPSWHGHGMANLANEIVCRDVEWRRCAVNVATRLALRFDHYEPDMPFPPDSATQTGGHLGLVGDLGAAILEELYNWQDNYPNTKLILNLSVGWDGELPGKDLDAKKLAELDTSSQAVYGALRVADQLGALVIASAGNRRGGEDSTSPLLPAAWELRPSWLSAQNGKSVYAVGGVDWQGLPLPNSRFGGRPRLVAYGDHAVARTGPAGAGNGGGEPTKMFTGTSVSTAVVSSIAAVAWHLRPDLKPARIMELIGKAGETLRSRADFYARQGGHRREPHMKKASLCRTVLRICGPDKKLCRPKLEWLDCRLAEPSAADLSAIEPVLSQTAKFTPVTSPPSCDTKPLVLMRLVGDSVSETQDCPMEKVPDMTTPAMTAPQPQDNPCPACTAVPEPPRLAKLTALALTPDLLQQDDEDPPDSYDLAAALDPDWLQQACAEHTTIESAILVIDCPAEPPTARFDISSLVKPLYVCSTPNVPVRIPLGEIGGRKSLSGCTASVDFTLHLSDDSLKSVQSPVYVDPKAP